VLWSTHYREVVSSHGFSQNQLCVWKYPSMSKICELTGHTARVLHMAISPDGETVRVRACMYCTRSPRSVSGRVGEWRRDVAVLARVRATSRRSQASADATRLARLALGHHTLIALLRSAQ
jgi:hypothetical protein